jgi:peptidoglycan/xylan/chitin deacetylase (PgdA/CDA1 family)
VGHAEATIVADLTSADQIPSNVFDCIILTQTLQFIYDVRAAITTLYLILKPGGVVLATFPGISHTNEVDWSGPWYWNFTAVSARRLFEEAFSAESVQVEAFGNVLAAISFLHGLAVDELTLNELDHRDPVYDVTITVRAVKPPGSDPAVDEALAGEKPQSVRHTKASLLASQAIILMYHRVAEGFSDPFSLAVSPARFAEQLEVLRKFATPVGLQNLVATLDNGGLSGPTAIVTFDDGYASNLLNAKPLLARHDVPATVFLTTGYLGGQGEFWWDELDRLLLHPGTLPQELRLAVNGTVHEWNLGEATHYPKAQWQAHRSWTVGEDTPTPRQSIFLDIWRLLQFLPDPERRAVLGELQTWAGVSCAGRSTHRPLSDREVVELADGELIEVGAHTVTHPVLASLSVAQQRDEIQQSKERTEEILGRRVLSFAYPFGSRPDYSPETAAIVHDVGFNCACSTLPRPVEHHPDRFQLPRFQVENWNGDEFARRLVKWFGS